MAKPVMRLQNPNAPVSRQQAILVATNEAHAYRERRTSFPLPPAQLLNETTALAHAKRMLQADGIAAPSQQQCLGKLVLPFGQYLNAPFHWLVTNDVGYMKYVVDKYREELSAKKGTGNIQNHWIKAHLAEYAESFPQISVLLEANVHQCVYGQKGFENHTFQEMWELYSQYSVQNARPDDFSQSKRDLIQMAYFSVSRWLNTPVTHITSVQLKRFQKYIYEKKNQMSSTPINDPSCLDDSHLLEVIKSESAPATATSKASSSSTASCTATPSSTAIYIPSSIAPSLTTVSSTARASATASSTATPSSSATSATPSSSTPSSTATTSSTVKRKKSLALCHVSSAEPSQSDSPVELEGWVRLWENPNGIPAADLSWVKDDIESGLFNHIQVFHDDTGVLKRRRVMKSDRMWFYPPEPPGYVSGTVPTPHLFFRSRIFVWQPVGVWRYSLKCPRGRDCVGYGKDVHLYNSGYHTRVRHICDISSWYCIITEVLSCGPCTAAARGGEDGKVGRWLAWDSAILCQLSEAHQAMFPAVLTDKRGVDKNVLRLLRDRTEGNTMVKVCRQIQENHIEEYLHRKDLYTTLLMTLLKPGGIVSASGHKFEAPPPQRELPSARLLRHAFLLAEANNVQVYRNQIISTFGTVLKMDSTKKVVKKLFGEGKGTAEWFTCIANEDSQIVSFVLTCEESTECLKPMCQGVMDRFQQANQPVPKILYTDRECCRAQGPTAVESLFQMWVENGMVVRLDIFHWIHRFDAAIRTNSHSKYAVFKSALAGAVLAYNRADLDLLIKAVRAKDPAFFDTVTDENMVRLYVSREQLKHHVRRVTLGAQETFRLIQIAIDELKGPAGLDENGVSLFKSPEAVDSVWECQQRHLECIQDPPGMNMYRVAHRTNINGVDVPYYKCLRGNNSLVGFHKSLPHVIPGPHCAAHPYQVYLISEIARWNSDRSSDAVFGGKGRNFRSYSAPLIERLNNRCQQLFGETVEQNFHAPAAVTSNELLGLEYLYSKSTGESGAFSLSDLSKDGPSPEEEVVQPDEPDPDEDDEAYQSDPEAEVTTDPAYMTHTTEETTTAHPPAFEDVCSPNPLPGFQQLENFCSLLVEIGQTENKLSLTTEQRNRLIAAWNAVEEHDKQPQRFHQLYTSHWGNTLYCHTKRDDLADAGVQRVKMAKRNRPAQQEISAQHNRLMYMLVKLLWLALPQSSKPNPEKTSILKTYDRIQHCILVEDPVLSKVGISLPKINVKTVQDFIRRQERLINLHSTRMPSATISKTASVSSEDLPPAPHQLPVLPTPNNQQIVYEHIPSKAGTKVLKKRSDMVMLAPKPPSQAKHPESPLTFDLPRQKTPAMSTVFRPLPQIISSTVLIQVFPSISTNATTPVTASTSATTPVTASTSATTPVTASTSATTPVTASTSTTTPVTASTSTTTPVTASTSTTTPMTASTSTTTPVTASTSTTTPVTASPSHIDTPQSVDNPSAWSRATIYKRKQTNRLNQVGAKKSRVHHLPVCTLCQQPTQGHRRYKKKTFCPVKMMSTSKGLDNRLYTSYEHFTTVVDSKK